MLKVIASYATTAEAKLTRWEQARLFDSTIINSQSS